MFDIIVIDANLEHVYDPLSPQGPIGVIQGLFVHVIFKFELA
jgi:hypothetical protein